MIRKGFTLMELVLATLMFGFMMMSLASIYSTANRHMFQSYRQNIIKSNASTAMKTITVRLSEANRIDLPTTGLPGNALAFAVNVDQTSGCYPVNPAITPTWHYFCYIPKAGANCTPADCLLYYHTANYTGPVGGGCPSGGVTVPTYPLAFCGPGGGGAVTLLASWVYPDPASPNPTLFSRTRPFDATLGNTLVTISLRVLWDPALAAAAGRDFRTAAHPIDTTLTTADRVTRAGQ